MQDQLNDDLKAKYPDRKNDIKNQRQLIQWNRSKEGAIHDYKSWRCGQKPFDDKNWLLDITQDYRIELGLQYEQLNERGCIKTVANFRKRIM